jgi:NAD(P)-dependent dehydrogenase (short-subunit alcohol dehydrogenase family)
MRVAIVGATGMLGHHTALAAVRAGHEVVVVYRNPRSLEAIRDVQREARQADLNDRAAPRNAFSGVDAVINCAGYYPTAPRPWRDEVQIAKGGSDAHIGSSLHDTCQTGIRCTMVIDSRTHSADGIAGSPRGKNIWTCWCPHLAQQLPTTAVSSTARLQSRRHL